MITQLKDNCPTCGKVAKELFVTNTVNKNGESVRLITLECFHVFIKVIPKATPYETMVSNDWKPEIKSCKHQWTKNQCDLCGEFKLFDFQVKGAHFIEACLSAQKGSGLFDDMGLGKTVQGLAVIKYHWKSYTPTLYVVKSALTYQWLSQILRWLGPDFLGQIIKTGRDSILPGLKTYIISYDLLKKIKREKIAALGLKLVILDECQQIKNPDSTRTQEVRILVGDEKIKVLGISGTPWKNRGSEFFPILNIIAPSKFWSYQHFIDNWVDFYYHGNKEKMGGIKNVERFRTYTSDILIRREYNEVMDEFPDINRMKLPVKLDDLSQSAYDESVSEFVAWYNDAVISGEEDNLNSMHILAKMSRMRHITGLAKIPATLGFIETFVEDTTRKLVVFVHHVDVGQLMISALTNCDKVTNPDWYELAEYLKDNGIKVMKLTSEFSDGERYTISEQFNSCNRVIMIASTIAAGEGVNLQTCYDSILHERQWNSQNEDQATPGRFRRIGQTSSVINITYPEGEGTIDQDLDYIVETKRRNFHNSMNKSVAPVWNDSDIGRELADMIVAKHKAKGKGGSAIKSSMASMKPKLLPKNNDILTALLNLGE